MDDNSQNKAVDEKSIIEIDINRSNLKEITTIPGIGKVLGKRIIESRPFSSIEDLLEVQGINLPLLQQIEPYIALPEEHMEQPKLPASTQTHKSGEVISLPSRSTTPPIIELPSATGESEIHEQSEAVDVPYDSISEEESPSKNRQLVPYHGASSDEDENEKNASDIDRNSTKIDSSISFNDAIKVIAASCILSVILSVVIILGLFGLINNSLNYPSQTQFEALDKQVRSMDSQIEILSQDIDSLSLRIDSLETVSGRVSSLEKDMKTVKEDLQNSDEKLKSLQKDHDALSEKTDGMQSSIDVFNRFLDELQILLGNLFTKNHD